MNTDSTDSDKTTCGSSCKKLWPSIYIIIQLIAYAGAVIQVIFCAGLFLSIIMAAFGAISAAYQVHTYTGWLDAFTGLGIGAQISREVDIRLFLIVLVLVLVAYCPLHVSMKLCDGLQENKEGDIFLYIICGVMGLGFRVWSIESYEYRNFPEDKTVLYCGLYALYLLLLVIICFEIRKARQAEIEEIPTASSRIRTFFAAMRSNDGTTIVYGRV